MLSNSCSFTTVFICFFSCKHSHDLAAYLKEKGDDLGDHCIFFEKTGSCPYGFGCRFLKAHVTPEGTLLVDEKKA